jgi:hypothetical protein
MDWAALGKRCWKWRAEQYILALKTVPDDEWVLMLDAYDTVLHPASDRQISDLVAKAGRSQMLISAERVADWCGPNCLELNRTRGWFANPGVILAKPWAIKTLLGAFLTSAHTDDQYFINLYINTQDPTWLRVDTDRALCHTIVSWIDHSSGSGSGSKRPAVYHFPGPLADIGYSHKYNSIVGEYASTDLVPSFSLRGLGRKLIKAEYGPIILFLLQVCTLWLSISFIVLKRVDVRVLTLLGPIVYYILHTYQTFT